MNVLSASTQEHVEDILVANGLISEVKLDMLRDQARRQSKPLLSLLISEGHISDEQLTKALAQTSGIPYVNLSNARIDSKILSLLPMDVAEHYMAVPLGEMQQKLVVAMLDADNIQAVDFLSNKIGRPLKVYAASETGIRHILRQYAGAFGHGISSMLSATSDEKKDDDENDHSAASAGGPEQKVQTIVQDSPISRA